MSTNSKKACFFIQSNYLFHPTSYYCVEFMYFPIILWSFSLSIHCLYFRKTKINAQLLYPHLRKRQLQTNTNTKLLVCVVKAIFLPFVYRSIPNNLPFDLEIQFCTWPHICAFVYHEQRRAILFVPNIDVVVDCWDNRSI